MRYIIITKKTTRFFKIVFVVLLIVLIAYVGIKTIKPKSVQTFSAKGILKEQLPKEDTLHLKK